MQRPLELGCDIVTHSTTKFLNGHSDSVGGIVVLKHEDDVEWMRFVQNAAGAILGPMDSLLVLRGTKTLPIRMERTTPTRMALAEHLAAHPNVHAVLYPGSPSTPIMPSRKNRCAGSEALSRLTSARSRRRTTSCPASS